MFVRTAFGPNARPGLEVVRIGETTDRQELVTVRSRAPFAPLLPAASPSEELRFGDPVVLLRAPFRLSFSYAGPDRVWKSNWHEADTLPAAIMLTVRDAATERVLSVSTVASIHAEAPAPGKPEGTEQNSKDGSKDGTKAANAASGQGGS